MDSGSLVTTWGAGNFIALKFTDIPADATSIKVGLHPSQGSGLVELDSDYNGVFKVTDKDTQVFRVETTINGIVNDVDYDLSDLICLT